MVSQVEKRRGFFQKLKKGRHGWKSILVIIGYAMVETPGFEAG